MTERQAQQPRYWTPVSVAIEQIASADPGELIDVVILGAGMAGLCAAVELAKHEKVRTIAIYEATSNRVGGRVCTYRIPGTGQYGELGAMRIPMRHDYTIHYIRDMGLKVRRFYNSGGATDLFEVTRGRTPPQWLSRADLQDRDKLETIFGELRDQEFEIVQDQGPEGLFDSCMKPLMDELAGDERLAMALVAGDFAADPRLQRWDQISEQDYIDQAGLSAAAKQMLDSLVALSNTSHWSLAAMLRDSLTSAPFTHGPWQGLWEIVDGLDRLPWAMKRRLDASAKVTFHFGHEVLAIRRDGDAGEVVLRAGDETKQVRIGNQVRLLSTIPFPVLAKRELTGLSADKIAAIRGYGYAKSTKVLLWSKPQKDGRPFWHTELGIHSGRSMTDRREPTGIGPKSVAGTILTYYPAPTTPVLDPPADATEAAAAIEPEILRFWSVQTHVDADADLLGLADMADLESNYRLDLLASYTFGENAEELGKIDRRERGEFCIARLEQLYRRDIREFIDPHHAPSMAWHQYEWTQGAFGIAEPGPLSAHYQAGRRAEGNIYFAGEQISIAPGWMQGAFESALAACRELLSDKASASQARLRRASRADR